MASDANRFSKGVMYINPKEKALYSGTLLAEEPSTGPWWGFS
jgi:hypothetical protein